MRLSVALHGTDLIKVIETYELLSRHYFTHASPTFHQAGTINGQLSSSFVLPLDGRDLPSTFRTATKCADIGCVSGDVALSVNQYPSMG